MIAVVEAKQPEGTSNMTAFAGFGEKVADFSTVSAVPAADIIDLKHLSRMTLGEQGLQREVLALFDRQAETLMPRIQRGEPAIVAASAHTLKGSAAGIGAFKVARAAETVEQLRCFEMRDPAFEVAIETLAALLEEAKGEIARRFFEHALALHKKGRLEIPDPLAWLQGRVQLIDPPAPAGGEKEN